MVSLPITELAQDPGFRARMSQVENGELPLAPLSPDLEAELENPDHPGEPLEEPLEEPLLPE